MKTRANDAGEDSSVSAPRGGRGHGIHRFGGDWTEDKLGVIAEYLGRYTTVLKHQRFRKAYIDAFAGTGYRESGREAPSGEQLLFPDLADAEPQALLDGSARMALKTEPPFEKYIFIERSRKRCVELEGLKDDFPALAPAIDVRCGDANEEILSLCQADWGFARAVLFLDPYGLQVEWTTIEAIAATRAIDLWILFPLGIGVNRLLTKSGDIPPAWSEKLNRLLGTDSWFDEFYRVEHSPDLFGGESEKVIKARQEAIGRYFVNRLKGVFPGVAEEPGVLRNKVNNPLYMLCFAASNEKGAPIALKIANHLLKDLR